jgi:hypothetical protein
MDPEWGHITFKMGDHPPFGAQIILNGHEYVACQAKKAKLEFSNEGNCFTQIAVSPKSPTAHTWRGLQIPWPMTTR